MPHPFVTTPPRARCAAGFGALSLLAVVVALSPRPVAAYSWLQAGGDASHSNAQTAETQVHRNNVGRLVRMFQVPLGGASDGTLVAAEGLGPSADIDLVFVTTTAGTTAAYDATTGVLRWSKSYPAGSCTHGGNACYTASTPVVAPTLDYVYAYGLDGKIHKLDILTGAEQGGAWPVTVSSKPDDEKSAGALTIVPSGGQQYLYSVHGGYPGDAGDYQGHVSAIRLSNGSIKVFNAACSGTKTVIPKGGCGTWQNAVWAKFGVTYSPSLDAVFFATGNGAWNGTSNWSESILRINADGSSPAAGPADSYTPSNVSGLDGGDTDLGSTGPVILPTPPGAQYLDIALQGGKDAKLRIVNLANLSGTGTTGQLDGQLGPLVNVPQGGGVFGQPAAFTSLGDGNTYVYVGTGSGLSALRVTSPASGIPSLATIWQTSGSQAGFSPLIANNLVFSQRGGIRAHDPMSGSVLWSSSRIGGLHWQSPMMFNGVLYTVDNDGNLSAFASGDGGMRVDVHSGSTTSNLNGMLEPGETVIVEPGLRNPGTATLASVTGTAGSLTGPAGATYAIGDSSAAYGSIAAGAVGDCFAATANCYRVSVSDPAPRPATHWDVALHETLSTGDTTTLLLHVGHSFPDVDVMHPMYAYIEALAHNQVTLGFGNGTFGPDTNATRAQTLLFVARAMQSPNGDAGLPFAIAGYGSECRPGPTAASFFADVPPGHAACRAANLLAYRQADVDFGCASGHACPDTVTSREYMSVMIADWAAGGDALVPDSGSFGDSGSTRSYHCSGGDSHFPDVPGGSASCRHINYLWARGVIDGFTDGSFQPAIPVSRAQMAKFMVKGSAFTRPLTVY